MAQNNVERILTRGCTAEGHIFHAGKRNFQQMFYYIPEKYKTATQVVLNALPGRHI